MALAKTSQPSILLILKNKMKQMLAVGIATIANGATRANGANGATRANGANGASRAKIVKIKKTIKNKKTKKTWN